MDFREIEWAGVVQDVAQVTFLEHGNEILGPTETETSLSD
jgi:hypothetical protein